MTILARLLQRFRNRHDAAAPERDPNGYALTMRPGFLGLYTATVEYVGLPWSPPSSILPSPDSDPPKAPATSHEGNVTPWAEWGDKIEQQYTPPGWTFCKFGVRGPKPDDAAEVWGIVRDGFGAYWCRFYVYIHGSGQRGEQFLAVAINARTGYAWGIFAHIQQACEAIEIALRLSRRGQLDQDPDAPEAHEAFRILAQALGAAGYSQGAVICRPMKDADVVPGPPIPVWMRSDPEAQAPAEVRPS